MYTVYFDHIIYSLPPLNFHWTPPQATIPFPIPCLQFSWSTESNQCWLHAHSVAPSTGAWATITPASPSPTARKNHSPLSCHQSPIAPQLGAVPHSRPGSTWQRPCSVCLSGPELSHWVIFSGSTHSPENFKFHFLHSWIQFCVCAPHFHDPFISWWMSRLIRLPSYCEYSRQERRYASMSVMSYEVLWYVPKSVVEGSHGHFISSFMEKPPDSFPKWLPSLHSQHSVMVSLSHTLSSIGIPDRLLWLRWNGILKEF